MKRIVSRHRALVALEMAGQGLGYQAIADALGFADKSGAWRAVQRALERREAQAVDEFRAGMLADLTLVQERAWRRAMAGDLEAGRIVMRAIEGRCRVLGI